MINRIREIRRARGLTLAELAAACAPPTTAQTIGRLETGTRNLSLKWMDRIGAALGVDPEQLVRSNDAARPRIIAELGLGEVHALDHPREAVMPHEIAAADSAARFMVLEAQAATGEYRPGDLIWLRRIEAGESGDLRAAINRDCLVQDAAGELAFGRLLDAGDAPGIILLPLLTGLRPLSVEKPRWIAVSEMLVRRL
jgi:transcriptional regulator with XRE-family HTH domain